MSQRGTSLRRLLKQQGIVIAPSAYDALTAKLIEYMGFKAISTTGYGISASFLGAPDVGLLSFYESLEVHRRIAGAVSIPVIADADTGYGGPLAVARTVREFERAGRAGVIREDQAEPKRCGYMPVERRIIPVEKMVAKIRAAVEARESEDFIIIARTDADDVSTEEAVRRMKAYLKAGADMVKSQPKSVEQLKAEIREVGAPMHVGLGIGPLKNVGVEDLKEWGLEEGVASFPLALLYASARAIMEVLDAIRRQGSIKGLWSRMVSFNEFNELLGLGKYVEMENRCYQPLGEGKVG